MYALLRIAPLALSVIGTVAIVRGYIAGKIPIEGAAQQLAVTLGICGTMHVGGLLLRTKTAELAAAPKPVAEIPNLPTTVSSLATGLEKETTRETGSVKIS